GFSSKVTHQKFNYATTCSRPAASRLCPSANMVHIGNGSCLHLLSHANQLRSTRSRKERVIFSNKSGSRQTKQRKTSNRSENCATPQNHIFRANRNNDPRDQHGDGHHRQCNLDEKLT